MGFWDDPKNVDSYIEMANGYDGRELVDYLQTVLDSGATVLELGMGPGKDLEMLAETFAATGSDVSAVFVDRYREQHPGADVMLLDAVELETDRTFDAIYSNKVLQHLTRDQIRRSLQRQVDVLRPGGIALHAVWRGEADEEHAGLLFTKYTEVNLPEVIPEEFEVVDIAIFTEMEPDDSLRVHLRRAPR